MCLKIFFLGDDFRKMVINSVFFACGYMLMRQSTVPLQNFIHFPRLRGLGNDFSTSPSHLADTRSVFTSPVVQENLMFWEMTFSTVLEIWQSLGWCLFA